MEIQDIKATLSIQAVLNRYGLSPDRNQRLNCPFHSDKTPSMQVYPKTNTVYCFSSNCKLHGKAIDQIDFMMHMENCTKHTALKKATELASNNQSNYKTKPMTMNTPPNEDLTKLWKSLRQKYYRSSKAKDYAKERHLEANKTELGFNPYSNKEFKQLQNCLIFPIKDIDGRVVSLYGRSISKNPKVRHFYMSKRAGLYPGYPDQSTKTLIITEAIIDASSLEAQTGNNQAVLALYGTNGLTEEHAAAASQLKHLEEVIFFFDGDESGSKAIEKHSILIKSIKPNIKISKVETPEGEDVNSLLDAHDEEILNHLIKTRIPLKRDETFLFQMKSGSPDRQLNKKENKSEISSTDNNNNPDLPSLNLAHPEYIYWSRYELEFTIIGGLPLYPIDRMVVTLGIKKIKSNRPLHNIRQKIDLYQDDVVEKLSRKVAGRMEMGTTRVHETLLELTGILEDHRKEEIQSQQSEKSKQKILSPERTQSVHKFIETKNLHEKTNDLIGKTGMVGEHINRMILWYVFSYRKSHKPLHVMCLGASGTGKTYLQEKIGALIPDEEKKEITAMSDNAVYYFEQEELVNKLLLIEDLDGANEEKVMYALRELMSKTTVRKSIVIKDSKGRMKTIDLVVKGPICLAGTTTRESLYTDNSDRSLLIYLDNSPQQKEAIMTYQRKLSAGKIDMYKQAEVVEFLQDVQLSLKPIKIINSYAEDLILPKLFLKPLRTNSHYLEFIKAVTFYHQRQRSVRTDSRNNKYIETSIEDIEIANQLMKKVLLAKSDELTKATRGFYELIKRHLQSTNQDSFYSGALRRAYRMSPSTVGRHLKILAQYGYLKIVSGSKKKGFEYELEKDIEDVRSKLSNGLDDLLKQIKEKHNKKD